MHSKGKKTNLQIPIDDAICNDKKKEKLKRDVSILGEGIFIRNKRKHMNKESLLASSFEVVVNELREKKLQRAKKIQKKELCQEKERKPQLEKALLPIHQITKQLIASYGRKKELILWAFKVLINETNAQIFLYLKKK